MWYNGFSGGISWEARSLGARKQKLESCPSLSTGRRPDMDSRVLSEPSYTDCKSATKNLSSCGGVKTLVTCAGRRKACTFGASATHSRRETQARPTRFKGAEMWYNRFWW